MPKLYLLRHAQAGGSLSGEDKDRPLSEHGIAQAKEVATHISDIDVVLCSAAKRTQMTLKTAMEAGVSANKLEILDELYNAPAGDILNAIQQHGAGDVLVVAHNPGIHQLANILLSDGEKMDIEKLRLSYRPATLSIFECEIESWKDLQPQTNTLINLIEID